MRKRDEEYLEELGQREDIREQLVDSFAPSIYGYRWIKQAILLQLVGGNSKWLADGTYIRGEVNIAIIGSRDSPKQRLGDYAAELSQDVVNKSLSEINDRGGSLGPGNDGGLLRVNDVTEISNGAYDQLTEFLKQRVPVLEDAVDTTPPNKRVSILAEGIPEDGQFDNLSPLEDQTSLDNELYSQFDLVLFLEDARTPTKVGEHVVKLHQKGNEHFQHDPGGGPSGEVDVSVSPEIPPTDLREYLKFAREEYSPTLTEEAREKIIESYRDHADLYHRDEFAPYATGAEIVDTLIRLSEAHARPGLSETVEKADVDVAGDLLRRSFEEGTVGPDTTAFPDDLVHTAQEGETNLSQKEILLDVMEAEETADFPGVPHHRLGKILDSSTEGESNLAELLQSLKQADEIYESRPGRYRKC